jgi:hypothetical protein
MSINDAQKRKIISVKVIRVDNIKHSRGALRSTGNTASSSSGVGDNGADRGFRGDGGSGLSSRGSGSRKGDGDTGGGALWVQEKAVFRFEAVLRAYAKARGLTY